MCASLGDDESRREGGGVLSEGKVRRTRPPRSVQRRDSIQVKSRVRPTRSDWKHETVLSSKAGLPPIGREYIHFGLTSRARSRSLRFLSSGIATWLERERRRRVNGRETRLSLSLARWRRAPGFLFFSSRSQDVNHVAQPLMLAEFSSASPAIF